MFAGKWMELEIIRLRNKSVLQRHLSHFSLSFVEAGGNKTIKAKVIKQMRGRGKGERKWGRGDKRI
jgi:hypothetical protein